MKILTVLISILSFAASAQTSQQIKDALLPLDESDRENATVMAYNSKNVLEVAKKGSNSLICLADDPSADGFSVACYHQNLDPFMARGRALKAEGRSRDEIEQIREKEAAAGQLKMPEKASTLYVLSGKTKEDANLRWVVYIPWATAESTGLPIKPLSAGAPWIMFPGSYRAHIMITPAP